MIASVEKVNKETIIMMVLMGENKMIFQHLVIIIVNNHKQNEI
jgi:hypothetical protein